MYELSAESLDILKAIPVGVIVVEKESGNIVCVNDFFVELTGFNPKGFSFKQFALETSNARTVDNGPYSYEQLPLAKALLYGKITRNQEIIIQGADKKELTLLVSAKYIANDNGQIIAAIAVVSNSSECKREREELHRYGIIQDGINRILLEALSARTEESLAELCLSVAEQVTSSKFGFIGELRGEVIDIVAISNPGWQACRITAEGDSRKEPSNFRATGFYGKVLRDGKGFYTNDPANHPDSFKLPAGHPVLTAFLGVPLISDGKTTGIIAIGNREKGYSQIDLEAIEKLTPAIVEAFAHKRAEAELKITKDRLTWKLIGLSKLHEMSMRLINQEDTESLFHEFLMAAIELTHADMGNMQILDKDGNLKIVTHHGFTQPFLDIFGCVSDEDHTACRYAKVSGKRVIVEDVTKSPIFVGTPTFKDVWAAGVRAVQSTPLCTRSGKLLGVISTHYREPHAQKEADLRFLDLLVRQAADLIERMQQKQKLDSYAKNLEKMVVEQTMQLRAAERLAAIGATAGMVGHDIRNPLQAMISDVYLATSELDSMPDGGGKEGIRESLNDLQKNIEYVNRIVRDLQDFARPLTPRTESVDIEKILSDILVKEMTVPDNVTVSTNVDAEASSWVVDPDLFKRIIANLVVNAVQAMPNGGNLTVCVYKKAKDLVVSVGDTGVGIPKAIRPKLFTPLFTTKSRGQGFGLSVVKRMTEALGGTVSFKSKENEGTTFTLRFSPKKR